MCVLWGVSELLFVGGVSCCLIICSGNHLHFDRVLQVSPLGGLNTQYTLIVQQKELSGSFLLVQNLRHVVVDIP